MEQHMDDEESPQKQEAASSKGSSVVSSASRDSLYRHFDKLTKDEQIAVLRDALGRSVNIRTRVSAARKRVQSASFVLSATNALHS
eukprot:1118569-Rhodomonas_salina.3